MKKLIFILFAIALIMTSCGHAKIDNAVVIEQINVLDKGDYKYEVKLKTRSDETSAFYYTNYRFQVGDSLVSYYENFDKKNSQLVKLKSENDSLRKELGITKYYLEILKERLVDTLKSK